MALFARLNKQVVPICLRTLGWLALVALFPAAVYGYTQGAWVGVKVFLIIGVVAALGLLWGFWGSLFPKKLGGS
ncbi:hypothetical protein CNR27_01110 [Luteimonas chenhongjianii]|uniref:Uncharacterized protein n=1 Tax=Luteimonas chenhongjianii TaxID=2006110 RepID=A0A290XAU4_9GAMM|nr:hypothetical protein CNR27_01110 [Luteimonas chenhongjianii]